VRYEIGQRPLRRVRVRAPAAETPATVQIFKSN
jgi:hypothetical protein